MSDELNDDISDDMHDALSGESVDFKVDLKDISKKSTPAAYKFDSSKISDLKYLEDIFSKEYDQFKSLEYLKKNHDVLIAQGYPQSPTLNEYLFWTTLSRRMQIIYQLQHKRQMETINDYSTLTKAEDTKFLGDIQKIADHITTLQKTLDSTLQTTMELKDVVDLHKETCEKAEKFLKAHFGEYVKADPNASGIKNIIDKAYWCFTQDFISKDTGKENIAYVWSEELKYLFDNKLIPLEYMAFVLRTSIEGLYNTAKLRNDSLSEINREDAEKKLKELMLPFEQEKHDKDMGILESSVQLVKIDDTKIV
jgi:gas vesicle protein